MVRLAIPPDPHVFGEEEDPPRMDSFREEEEEEEEEKFPEDHEIPRAKSRRGSIFNRRTEIRRMSTLSRRYDVNKDGKLSPFERWAMRADVGGTGNVDASAFIKLAKSVTIISAVAIFLLLTTVACSAGLYIQSKQQGKAVVGKIEENAVTAVAMDEMGVTHLTDKSGHDVSIRSFGDVFTATRVVDSMHGNRELQCIAIAEVAEIVHAVGSGTEVSLAFLDDGGLENQIMPLSGKFQDSGNVLKFGQDNQVQVLLDSDACNVVDDHPRDIDDAAPKDYEDEPLGIDAADHARGIDAADHARGIDVAPEDEDEDDGELNTKSEAANIFDSSKGGSRHLIDNHSLPSSTVHQTVQSRSDILAKHRLEYTTHRAALQAGTRSLSHRVISSYVPVSVGEEELVWANIANSMGFCLDYNSRYEYTTRFVRELVYDVVVRYCSSGFKAREIKSQLWRQNNYGHLLVRLSDDEEKCLNINLYDDDFPATLGTPSKCDQWILQEEDGRYIHKIISERLESSFVLGVRNKDPCLELTDGSLVQAQTIKDSSSICACAQEWLSFNPNNPNCAAYGSTEKLVKALTSFKTSTRQCEGKGLAIAEHIRSDIVPNLNLVNDLLKKIETVMEPLKKIYDNRAVIKMIVKFIPKVGKLIGLVVEKMEDIYLLLEKLQRPLKPLTRKLTSGEYLTLTGESLGSTAFTVADGYVYRLVKVEKILDETKIVSKTRIEYKTGIANHFGYTADAAETSIEALSFAKETCPGKTNTFSESVLNEVELLQEQVYFCRRVPSLLLNVKLGFIKAIYDILILIADQFKPLLDMIDEIISKVQATAVEFACCSQSPHVQFAVGALASVIDFGSCFAGPLEGLVNDLLRELIPDVAIDIDEDISISKMVNFTFKGIEYNEDDCSLSYEGLIVDEENVGSFDFAFEFQFDMYEALGIEDDGSSFEDNLKESCDPDKLVSDIESLVGGDCCCAARGLELEPTSFCLDWDAFFLPYSYEVASIGSGYDRCTCCPDGIFGTEGCGGEIGYCGTAPIQRSLGQSCPSTADCECEGTNECGKKDYWHEDEYVCCKDTIVPLGWTTDLCVQQNEGDRCGTTEDAECAGRMGCARRWAGSSVYVCCKEHSIYSGEDYCNDLDNGRACWSDAMCHSGWCKGNNGGLTKGTCDEKKSEGEACPTERNSECHNGSCYRSTRYGNYKCCANNRYCWPTTPGDCLAHFYFCVGYGL